MSKTISYGKQTIDQSDIDAVVKVLEGDWLTQGPAVENFEMDLKIFRCIPFLCCLKWYSCSAFSRTSSWMGAR